MCVWGRVVAVSVAKCLGWAVTAGRQVTSLGKNPCRPSIPGAPHTTTNHQITELPCQPCQHNVKQPKMRILESYAQRPCLSPNQPRHIFVHVRRRLPPRHHVVSSSSIMSVCLPCLVFCPTNKNGSAQSSVKWKPLVRCRLSTSNHYHGRVQNKPFDSHVQSTNILSVQRNERHNERTKSHHQGLTTNQKWGEEETRTKVA